MSEQPIITSVPSQEELMARYQPAQEENGITTYFAGAEYYANAIDVFEQKLTARIGDNEPMHRSIRSILHTGIDAETGQELRTDEVARNVGDEIEARKRLAYIAANHPETYTVLRDNGTVGFHGTRSSALAGILMTGELRSAKAMHEDTDSGAFMLSGEHVFQAAEGQGSISFSGLSDLVTPKYFAAADLNQTKNTETVIAELHREADKLIRDAEARDLQGQNLGGVYKALHKQYERAIGAVEAHPDGLEATLLKNNFPVLIGLSGDFVEAAEAAPDPNVPHTRTISGQSEQAEFRPLASRIPIKNLIFAVPADRVDGMRRLLDMFHCDNSIVAIDALGPDNVNLAA